MKSSKVYTMNGKQYKSMMDIARELGRKRVYPKDFDKLGIQCVDVTDKVEYKQLKLDTTLVQAKQDTSEKVQNVSTKKVKRPRTVKRHGTSEEIAEALKMAGSVSVDEFSNYIKHFSLSSLVKLAKKSKVNAWNRIENEAIRKMRILMSLKRHFYPNTSTSSRKPSQWKNIPLQNLLDYADAYGLAHRVSDNSNIQRMWVINALNNAGVTPVELLNKIDVQVDLGMLNSMKMKRCDNNQSTHLH